MVWGMIAQMVVSMVISYAISAAMAPKPQQPTAGQLDIPEPQPGALVGVGFGTNVKKDANIIWYGDPHTVPIRKSAGK